MQFWVKILIFGGFIGLIDRFFITAPQTEKLKVSLYQNNLDLKVGNVLTEEGNMQHSGYLAFPTLKWDQNKALNSNKSWRFKKWDFYSFYLEEMTLCVAFVDLWYVKNAFITIYRPGHTPVTYEKVIFPWSEAKMSEHSLSGTTFYNSSDFFILFTNNHENYKQVIANHLDIEINLQYRKESDQEGMVYLGPFTSDYTHYFYSHKQYNYLIDGYVKIGNEELIVSNELGMMDWGRGVWPYHGGWIWGSGLGKINGVSVGLNIGELPKSNIAEASDDCITIGKKMIKLGIVNFEQDSSDPNLWNFFTINSKPDSRYAAIKGHFKTEKTFNKEINFWVIKSKLLQLFGTFEGVVTTIDEKFEFSIRGIVENHESRW